MVGLPVVPPEVFWGLIVVLVLVPLVSFLLLVLFAATADFKVRAVRLRGETWQGVIASVLARMAVGDVGEVHVPLEIEVEHQARVPIRVKVQDVEVRLLLEDMHLSTITESSSFDIGRRDLVFLVPLHVDVDLRERALDLAVAAGRLLAQGGEVKVEVRGHVILRHWVFTRTVPVRFTRYVPLGRSGLRVASAGWRPERGGWRLEIVLTNPRRADPIEGRVEVALVRPRGLLPDDERVRHPFDVDLDPGERRVLETHTPEPDLYPVVYFEGRRIWPGRLDATAPKSGQEKEQG